MKKIIITSFFLLFSWSFHAQISKIKNTQILNNKVNSYYRVTAKGFICNRETADDMLERDGKRDEIYLATSAVTLNADEVSVPNLSYKNRSRTLGDINAREPQERRAMAGTISSLGGIQTGDNIPDVEPWKNAAPASGDLLPFVLWEGDFSAERSWVLITPSIMEWDGPMDFLTNFWHNSFVGQLLRVPTMIASAPYQLLTQGINSSNGFGYDESTPGIFPATSFMQKFPNTVIKVNEDALTPQQKQEFFKTNSVVSDKPADRPIGVVNSTYNPIQFKLNQSDFEKICSTDFGYGKGIVPVKFKDQDQLKGDYTVFYAFEKITEEAEKNKISVVNNDVFDSVTQYKLRNVHANKVTDLLNAGDVLVLNDDKNIITQKFLISKEDQYYFKFKSPFNNGLMDTNNQNGRIVAATTIQPRNKFALMRYCDGSWIIKLANDLNIALSTENAGTAILTPVNFEHFSNSKNQRWFIEK